MITMLCLFLIFWVLHRRFGLTLMAICWSMLFGSIVALFLGKCGAIAGTLLWAVLSISSSYEDP